MSGLEEFLIQDFEVSCEDLDKAREYHARHLTPIEEILVNMGSISREQQLLLYAKLLDLPVCNDIGWLDTWSPPPSMRQDRVRFLLDRGWVPVESGDQNCLFRTSSPLNTEVSEWLRDLAVPVSVELIPSDWVERCVGRMDSEAGPSLVLSSDEEARLKEMASEAPTVNLLNSLIADALKVNASDLHIEPDIAGGLCRLRIDGVLQNSRRIGRDLFLPLVTRVKILAGLDIAEKRRPQDGKIDLRISGESLDARVSSLPLPIGESIVLRFLRKQTLGLGYDELGIAGDIQSLIRQDLSRTSGVVLMTGPTGSGKTTSLYSFISQLNSSDIKIVTLEDPVEYQVAGVNQVQVRPDIGFDFAHGLRAIVRQDPDVILVGEIRDGETARVAMQSALTGHLVLSTVHTNDAVGTYTRLLELGVEEYLLNAALQSIMAQRLVRKLCGHCAVADESASVAVQIRQIIPDVHVDTSSIRQPVGCDACNGSGFSGRVSIIEYLRCDEVIKAMDKSVGFHAAARKYAASQAWRSLLQDGALKVSQGTTTLDEVLRVAG